MSIISMLMTGGSSNPTNGPLLYANITSNTETYTFSPSAVTGYIAGNTTATLTITDNVYLYSNDVTIPALTVSGWHPNDTVYVINKGYILGRGGDGGKYISPEIVAATSGGTAIKVTANTTIFNYNSIAGGGGGGGSGNRTTMGSGGGGAGGGYGGATFSATAGSGTTTSASLNLGTLVSGQGVVTTTDPNASIVVRSIGATARTLGINNGGTANNAYIKINGTKITVPDRSGAAAKHETIFAPDHYATGTNPLSWPGINVVTLNPTNLAVETALCYYTQWTNANDFTSLGGITDIVALNTFLTALPSGKIVVMEALMGCDLDASIINNLKSNFGAPSTVTTSFGGSKAFVFIGTKGASPGSGIFQISSTIDSPDNMLLVSAAFGAATSSGGQIAAGGIGGGIGQVGANGSIVTSSTGSRYGSGGGGGRIIDGVGGLGGIPSANVVGFGGGAGGGGGGADGLPSQSTGGGGGSLNQVGYNGINNNTVEGGGGGGGWGASGGFGALGPSGSINNVATPGSGGKSIERNGKQVILAAVGTLYGSIV